MKEFKLKKLSLRGSALSFRILQSSKKLALKKVTGEFAYTYYD